jgi:hypothetical protein
MQEIGVEYHDDASALGSETTKDRALYIDYTHVTPEGAKVVAEKLFPYVYPKVSEILKGTSIGAAAHP